MQSVDQQHEPDIDEEYWQKAILQRGYYRPQVGFDRYRWALRYGQMARKLHGASVQFDDLIAELAAGWEKFGGHTEMSWEEAHDAIRDSWNFTESLFAEGIANRGGFKTPPTFTDNPGAVPRNLDEPNC